MAATIGLEPRRERLGIGPVGLGRLVACEVLAAASAPAWLLPRPTGYIASGVAALAIAAIVLLSLRGVGHRLAVRFRQRGLRKRARVTPTKGDTLSALAPRLNIAGVIERDVEYGIGFDGNGWFVGIAIQDEDPGTPTGLSARTLGSVARVLLDPAATVSGIQIVSHLIPAPSAELDPDAACIESYRELLGDDPTVSHHTTWVAIRLDVTDAYTVAEERGGGVEGARRAVTAMTGRLLKRLTDAGVGHRVLGADGLRVVLTHSVSGETVSASLAERAVEEWSGWRIGSQLNVTFGIDGSVDDINGLRRLWTALAMVSASFSTLSVTLRPWRRGGTSETEITVESLLRVAYDDEVDDGVAAELTDAARECGIRLWRFDGEQAVAAYASAPTGGGYPGR
ncbi:type VII secretion protein EccE [Stackebrandtia nassauensis]|uniref:Type VII secretion system protein EccE domain-containing protein n=1 Tax=Stackebrandtia nassauensis (strain DSM 44728 / CIP 108903 / NRRL B-16338 / NBRC 102104 / LLR-40K-21) TaxID=446470 RepID=D3Q6Y9_STANL|nr:type VII secretion protein EccE [Stackebrandtia nassauensis]ADD40388.1 hypothetical protein Snas_0675 [Stackebrandtia nassauensis DSM 44728]